MKLEEKKLNSNYVYKGKVVNLRVDDALLPNGNISKREIIEHNGGVGILAIDGGEVILVRQYRYAFSSELLEIPAGKLEKNEDPFNAAVRELKEETGAIASNWKNLGVFYPTVGYCEEKIFLYLATDLSFGETNFDDDEFINIERYNIEELKEKVRDNTIKDGKTIVAVLKYLGGI